MRRSRYGPIRPSQPKRLLRRSRLGPSPRRRGLLLLAVPGLLLAAHSAAEESDSVLERARKTGQERRSHWEEERERIKEQSAGEVRRFKKTLEQETEELLELGSRPAITGDVNEIAREPDRPAQVVDRPPIADMYEASAEDFDYFKHRIWSLKPEDFRFWRPARVMIDKPLGARNPYEKKTFMTGIERTVFRDVFFAVPFALTNSTDMPLRIGPRMWLVSENMRFTQEIGGFIAQQDVERSMFRELNSSADFIGYVKQMPDGSTEEVGTFSPGETRYGVGIFHLPDPEFDELTLVIDGLNNTYRFDRRQKRVLAIRFSKPGDEFYPTHEPLEYKGKEWAWLWMWYEDLEVASLEHFVFETPSGVRKEPKTLWAYQVTLSNHTNEPQAIRIREFNTILKARALGVDVEVEFVDDGKSTIHKARVMEEMAQPFQGDRFDLGTLDPEQAKVFLVIFDRDDVNWDKVYEQVERGLTGDISIGYGEPPLKPGLQSFLVDPAKLAKVKLVVLTDEQRQQVRGEILGAIEEAVTREQQRRMITADVTAEAGLASGTYRIMRSYFRKGIIDSNWIHKWDEF